MSKSKVITNLKQIQADSIVFYMKLHNLHWNVEGVLFKAIHQATEEIYENFADIFDDCAERIIQLGEKPYVTIADVIKDAKIEELSTNKFRGEEVLAIILKDFEYFLKSFKNLSSEAEQVGDTTSTDYANSVIAQLEKNIWMLKAQLS